MIRLYAEVLIMITCNTCGLLKEDHEFARRGQKRHYKCKICMRIYSKKQYELNRQAHIDKSARRKKAIKDWVNEQKDVPCADCGQKFHHCAMDFDHLANKSFNIGEAANKQYPKTKIIEEIAKCEIVCSNCHRLRTWKRANNK
jgi:5-methylcytosine-specific restriction endonuclease McrA